MTLVEIKDVKYCWKCQLTLCSLDQSNLNPHNDRHLELV